ncbi:hypothetical protein F2Q69_00040094 [Brassica cretica]|uniref:Uncharacterized protein n=1 Tax=Brassica cretica TaxID=69181 RepID=A0A8S9NFD2_BRACR|nr:hypothetical protein F2Q69_00040094 [Brassica cretica]
MRLNNLYRPRTLQRHHKLSKAHLETLEHLKTLCSLPAPSTPLASCQDTMVYLLYAKTSSFSQKIKNADLIILTGLRDRPENRVGSVMSTMSTIMHQQCIAPRRDQRKKDTTRIMKVLSDST